MNGGLAFGRMALGCAALGTLLTLTSGCKDNDRFATRPGESYQGTVVFGNFVRAGIGEGTTLCLTLDPNRLQDTPGTVTSSDGRFQSTLLRPIPQLFHDPLSTLSFGEGRLQNLVYMASPAAEPDVTVFLSLMENGDVEVRLLRSAPSAGAPDASATSATGAPIFGVFSLTKHEGGCP